MKCLSNERNVGEMKDVGGENGAQNRNGHYEKQSAPIFTEDNKSKYTTYIYQNSS
jgi:hypothetical protein